MIGRLRCWRASSHRSSCSRRCGVHLPLSQARRAPRCRTAHAHPKLGVPSLAHYGFDDGDRMLCRTPRATVPYRLEERGDWSLIEFPPVLLRALVRRHESRLAARARRSDWAHLWQRKLGRCIASSPAVAGHVLIVGVLALRRSAIAMFRRTSLRSTSAPVERCGGTARDRWRRHRSSSATRSSSALGRPLRRSTVNRALRWSFATGGPIKAGAALAGWTRSSDRTTARSMRSTRARARCAGRRGRRAVLCNSDGRRRSRDRRDDRRRRARVRRGSSRSGRAASAASPIRLPRSRRPVSSARTITGSTHSLPGASLDASRTRPISAHRRAERRAEPS